MNRAEEIRLDVPGMTCGNCARNVTEALRGVPGVRAIEVDIPTRLARVRADDESTPKLIAALAAAGYAATAVAAGTEKRRRFSGWNFNVLVALPIATILLVAELIFGLGQNPAYKWIAFFLAAPVQFWCGYPFYKGAWEQLRVGRSNMDALVALGSSTAFFYSVAALLLGQAGHVYFMDAAAIIGLVSLGHFLEERMTLRVATSLKSLLKLTPERAVRLNGLKEEEVAVSALLTGDMIVLKPGAKVPVDGTVIRGESALDESMLTGESLPSEKKSGSQVYAGTLNQTGRLLVRAEKTGEATAVARIIEVVREAQSSRADIQKLGDQVSNVFVPVVVLLAIITAFWWALAPAQATALAHWLGDWFWMPHLPEGAAASAVFHAAAVLIIACPCAMGLATPIAIMAGTNAAAARGILITNARALETSGKITAVLFDKTGTLTQGRMSVAAHEVVEASSEAIKVAAALAASSNHPISKAIAALGSDLQVGNWSEIRGSGVQGEIAGEQWRLGSLAWLGKEGVNLPENQFTAAWAARGATVLGASRGSRLELLMAVRDEIKPAAAAVIERLIKSGKKVFLVSGDAAATARAIGLQAGFPEVNIFGGVTPEGKAELIRKLQREGHRVAFAGDGINDAPALSNADLGIAMMQASDVAREAADIILLKADVEAVPEALELAQATLRTIKQNLFWAFFYNALGVPLAALGLFTPMMSAAAMGLSDLIVIGNALRLRNR